MLIYFTFCHLIQRYYVSLVVSLMIKVKDSNTKHCRIDQRSIGMAIKQQKDEGKRHILADSECKGLRLVINNKSASWTYAYRRRGFADGGKRWPQRTLKLGDLKQLSPANARYQAENIKAEVRQGRDPAAEQRKKAVEYQLELERKKTCFDLAGSYIATQLSADTKHNKNEAANLRKALEEIAVSQLEASLIKTSDVRRLVELHKNRPATAYHRFGALSRFLDILVEQEKLISNPAKALSKKSKPKRPVPRSRYYTSAEIHALWQGAQSLKSVYRNFARFLIVFPFRIGETAELVWDQIDFSNQIIQLSADNTKNAEHFLMPIPSVGMDVLKEIQGGTGKIFNLSSKPDAKMTSWSHLNKKMRSASGINDFSFHHCRRTFSSLLGESCDFDINLIDSLLNRKESGTKSGVLRHYQHAQRLNKRREVMEAWSDLLRKLVRI